MKSLFPFLFFLIIVAESCQPAKPKPWTTPSPPTINNPFDVAWEDRSIFLPGLLPSYHAAVMEMSAASVYHLQLQIDDDLVHIKGTEVVRYVNTEQVPLKEICFRLYPNILGGKMNVSQVLENDRPVIPDYQLNNSLMVVPLKSPLEPGQSVVLGMDFTVRVPESVELNYGVLASTGGVLTLAHAYPIIPVFDKDGWDTRLPPHYGDLTYSDMAFFIVKVTAPKDLTLVDVGHELSRTENGLSQVVYSAAGPVRDFYLAASPGYFSENVQSGETRVNFFTPDAAREAAKAGLQISLRALEIFNDRYGQYPYTELDFVTTPTAALGIEYPGMIAISERILTPGDMLYESTIVHEVAHQWFYNLIGSDQLNDPWLDESVAQFLTWQYYADIYGEPGASGFRQSLENRWERVEGQAIPIGLPVEKYSGLEYGAIVYGRGPLFIKALQQEMGTVTFDEFMRDYAQTFSWGIATPDLFLNLAERHCSCDLSLLFNDWVYP